MKHLLLTLTIAAAIQVAHGESKAPVLKQKAQAAAPKVISGKVTETMNTAGYTYVLLDTGAKKIWAAAVQFDVKKGDTVAINGGMPMEKYHSKTLNRDFDVVYFASDVQVNGKSLNGQTEELPPGHPPLNGASSSLPKGHPEIPSGKPADTKVDACCIKKAGNTVAEVYKGKAALKGKPVTVRGKVVKYNGGILGKNWLHIDDGSGSDSLVITTATEAKVGDTVLVDGKVSTDRDFGYGYKYGVMVEDAKVTVE